MQGITFTIGIEIPLAGDIIVAASDARFCQLEPKRGLAPLGGATIRYVQRAGWGNAMYHLLTRRRVRRRRGLPHRARAGGRRPGPAGRAGAGIAAELCHVRPARRSSTRSPTPASRSTRTSRPPIAAIPAMSEAVRATADFQEGIASFIERRAASFSGR